MLRCVHSLLTLIINISHILEQLLCYHVMSTSAYGYLASEVTQASSISEHASYKSAKQSFKIYRKY